jgi:hypothetical protein
VACRRGAGDELLDKLAITWSVNLLRVPRGGVHVADVFVVQARNLHQWDRLEALYRPTLELPRPKRQGVGDMDQVESQSYGADAGFEALQGFLQGLGVPALPLRAAIKAARQATVSLSFSVGNVSRTALLPGVIKREMDRRARGARWDSAEAKRRYVVAHAVWEATSLQISLKGSRKTVGDLSAGLVNVASGHVGLKAADDSSGTIKYERQQPVAFGIQVTGVRFDDGVPKLEGVPDLTVMAVREDGDEAEPPAEDPRSGLLIGARDGSPFVTFR